MVTFTVKNLVENEVPVVFKFAYIRENNTYGSKLTNGVAGRGRPSKFASELVTLSEPVETPVAAVEGFVEVEKTENPVEVQPELPLNVVLDGVPVPDAEGNVSLD